MPTPDRPNVMDVTESVYARMMEHVPKEWRDRFSDPMTWDNSMRDKIAALLIPSMVSEAIAQSQTNGGRGLMLYDQKPLETQISYVDGADSSAVLWMANASTHEEIAELLQRYNPEQEAVAIMLTPSSIQSLWIRADRTIHTSGAKPVDRTPITLPPEVSLATEQHEGFYCYSFQHRTLGELGRIRLVPRNEAQIEFQWEVASSEDSVQMQQRQEIFEPIAQEFIARLEAGLQ